MTKILNKILFFILIVFTQASLADWRLCNQSSSLNFTTSQDESLTEVHSFSNMEGVISDQGKLQLQVDLGSVETNNSVRNLRLQDLLFETNRFQNASVDLNLGENFFSALEIDKSKEVTVQVTLNLHGITHTIDTRLMITRLKNNCILVMSLEPVVISLKDFDLLAGLEKFRQLSKLDSISKTAIVSFNMFFRSSAVL